MASIMNADMKERLIELVREKKCIYCKKHKYYKNKTYKNILWEKIGASLGLTSAKAKDMWRTLRDGYIRYKKSTLGLNDSARRYSHYTWSAQMAFLDETLMTRLARQLGDAEPTSPGPASSPSPPPPLSPASQSTLLHQTQPPPVTHPTKRRNTSDVTDDLDNHREIRDWDSVDHLFMSYAKSFKRLPLRRQITMKVQLAQLFAEAELEAAEANEINITVVKNEIPLDQ